MARKVSPTTVIFVTILIDLIGFGIIIPLSPFLATRYGASPFEVGLLMTIFALMQFLASPFWGLLSDRIGRRPVILLSLLGSTVSYLMFAFATDLSTLYISRLLAGLFGASISTTAAYIADSTTSENRSKEMGLVGAAFGIGFIIGPIFGAVLGSIGTQISDQAPFGMSFSALGASILCFLNFLLATRILKESLPKEKRMNKDSKKKRFGDLISFAQKPLIGPLLVVGFFAYLAMGHMESTFFLYVKDRFSWDHKTASMGFAYVGLLLAFTQGFLIRKLLPIWGERKLLVAGFVLSALGLAGMGLSPSILTLALSVTLFGLGTGLRNPTLMGSLSLIADPTEQGRLMGANQSLNSLARIIGPAMAGYFYQALGLSSPLLIGAVLMVLGLALLSQIYRALPTAGLKRA